MPAVQSQDRQQPGWYPDTTERGLMRYWDGFHFTGQAKRPSAERRPTAPPVPKCRVDSEESRSRPSMQ